MGNRTKLLATVALPLAALIWQPAYAAAVRPAVDVTTSNVILAQAEELSPQELRKQRQEQRKKAQEQRQQRQEQRKNAQEQRQQKRENAQQEQQQDRKAGQQAEERRKAQQQRQQQAEQKKQQAEQQKARQERRKEQQAEENKQADQQKARQERRKAQQAEEKKQADQQKARQERRKEQQQNAAQDEQRKQNAAERKQQAEREKLQEERRKARQAGQQDDGNNQNAGERPRRKTIAEREAIARDPSKSRDTVVLPVERGAAVLDSDKEADNRRGASGEELRRQRAEERRKRDVRVPRSDADAQVDERGNRRKAERMNSALRERGERLRERPGYRDIEGVRVQRRLDNRVVINVDNRIIVRHDEGRRIARRAKDNFYEGLPNGRTRHVIVYPNGDRVVTIRNRFGDIVQRSRFVRNREYVLFYAPGIDRPRPVFIDPAPRLPPLRLTIPVSDYIIDTSSDQDRNYYEFLDQPPVEPVERVYSLDEVKYSARIRDKMRRIDLDTITFDTGSAEISMDQATSMRKVADAINKMLDEDPSESFLIEGHTDAVGSDESNLILSDERAESVANVLTDVFDIPAENLVTQGYGEQFLKVDTDESEQLNRRVTIRRVTPLVKPVESAGIDE
jgi:outer membrane protein OmpA-like peptidoglycan-associated protein